MQGDEVNSHSHMPDGSGPRKAARAGVQRSVRAIRVSLNLVLLGVLFAGCGVKPPEDTTPKAIVCSGTPETCLRILSGWTMEGRRMDLNIVEFSCVRLDDGRYRLYGDRVPATTVPPINQLISFISNDGLVFGEEPGVRLETKMGITHVIRTQEGLYRAYFTDFTVDLGPDMGASAVSSAISTDGGLTFSIEPGERLTYSGSGYEAKGFGQARVLLLADRTYRMYYQAIGTDYSRILSAVSTDGLSWSREDGIRVDIKALCPATDWGGALMPFIDPSGVCHLFARTWRCTGNFVNTKAGIFDSTSSDGLTFTFGATPVIEGYTKPDNTGVDAEDFCLIQTPDGLRVYFALFNAGATIPETAIYSIINSSIK